MLFTQIKCTQNIEVKGHKATKITHKSSSWIGHHNVKENHSKNVFFRCQIQIPSFNTRQYRSFMTAKSQQILTRPTSHNSQLGRERYQDINKRREGIEISFVLGIEIGRDQGEQGLSEVPGAGNVIYLYSFFSIFPL